MRLIIATLFILLSTRVWAINPLNYDELNNYITVLQKNSKALEIFNNKFQYVSSLTNDLDRTLSAVEQNMIASSAQRVLETDLALSLMLDPAHKKVHMNLNKINLEHEQNLASLGESIINLNAAYIRHLSLSTALFPLWQRLKARLILEELHEMKSIVLTVDGKKVEKKLKKPIKLRDILYEVTSYEYVTALKNKLNEYKAVRKSISDSDFGDPFFDNVLNELDNAKLFLEYDDSPLNNSDHRNPFEIKGGSDIIVKGAINISNFVSGIFGNAVGSFRTRKGYLYNNEEAYKDIASKLQPFDIVLEKTPFALTDKFIPGNFGHAALYLGTEKQLKELGLWEMMGKYQSEISNGNVILEAIRPGVGLTSIRRFLNIDEIAIVRVSESDRINVLHLSNERMLEIALAQIGKDYDFTFNVELENTIVCSELIYRVFETVRWPVGRNMGRNTISPDNVAEVLFFKETPFKLVDYIFTDKPNEYQSVPLPLLGLKVGYKNFDFDSETYFKISDPNREPKLLDIFYEVHN